MIHLNNGPKTSMMLSYKDILEQIANESQGSNKLTWAHLNNGC